MNRSTIRNSLWVAILIAPLSFNAVAQNGQAMEVNKARVVDHWTSERRAAAIPRDLVIDPRGLGYLRGRDGVLHPYGHNVAAELSQREPSPSPLAKPSGGKGDTTPPSISNMDPAAGVSIPDIYTFSAKVTDASGVKSVSFSVQKGTAAAQSLPAKSFFGDTWSVTLMGFTDGDWNWWVVAKDASRRGNTATSPKVSFTVNTGGGGGGTVSSAPWESGGTVQYAAGRLYFEMPSNKSWTAWTPYVCSGTVAKDDDTPEKSTIITAAHCVYDDVNKAFARNVMFIPNQDGTSGTGTDLNCNNDPIGCWAPSLGIVDVNWTSRTFPDNIAWDYAFYLVKDTGAHAGRTASSETLDVATTPMTVSFDGVSHDVLGSADYTHALGYSYDVDPNFMYCAEDMTTNGADNWWLPSCDLSGGSSGGPWVQPMSAGNGPIISVNSWGYTYLPGMAGPILDSTMSSAECVFGAAKAQAFPSTPPADGKAGTAVTCP